MNSTEHGSWVLAVIVCLVLATPGLAEEKILSFHSDIDVREDGSMRVTETIEVRAENDEINRGIYRDFPTRYEDRLGNYYTIPFRVQSVRRDGESEPHFTESRPNGVRLYIGEEDRYLDPGVYEYEITYETDRAIGFFENHDELYWDVTGHQWGFDIEEASVEIALPEAVPASNLQVDAYTGYQGSGSGQYDVTRLEQGTVALRTTESLQEKQGLTIAFGWPKGVVEEPTTAEKVTYFLSDNRVVLVGILGLILVLTYYVVVWLRVGIDPEKGLIVPRYEPPEGISPAAVRYVNEMGYDDRTFATALVNLAVKGFVEIEEDAGEYTVRRQQEPDDSISDGERALMLELFGEMDEEVELKQDNHERIQDAMDALQDNLEDGYLKKFFFKHTGYFLGGVVLSLLALGSTYMMGSNPLSGEVIALGLFLTIWSVAVGGLLKKTYREWSRFFRTRGVKKFFGASGSTAFTVPFVLAEGFIFWLLINRGGLQFVVLILLFLGVNVLFYVLLKAPTVQGRELIDKIQGLKRYLTVAEKDRLDLEELPEKTPELFERLLPYAIALEVGNEWAESFTDVFDLAEDSGEGYRPAWYHGTYHGHRDFTSGVSDSLSSTVATSSVSPSSSSSGIGGGGFSGGGVGGGGGGGW